MKKVLPVFVVVIVIVAGLVIGRQFFPKKVSQVTPGEVEVEQKAPQEEKGFTGRLKDALILGQSMKCTWKTDENNFGTAHVKNNKIYTEAVYGGKKMYSILADNCTYSWEEGATDGFKLCSEPEEPEEVSMPEEFSWETADINYRCVKTVVSDSLFNPPSNIEFISPLEMMGQ